jgi:hypothetical protein
MDISASKYSGATSESGWTQYLSQSSISESYFQRKDGHVGYEENGTRFNVEEKFEEDLSMVSDASSGPPHYDNEYYCDLSSTTKESLKKNNVKKYDRISQQPSLLDDTASSPFFTCPKKNHKVNVTDLFELIFEIIYKNNF